MAIEAGHYGCSRRREPLLAAQAYRVAVGVGEDTHPRSGCDLARGVAFGCSRGQQGFAGGVEVVDIGEGYGASAVAGRIEADLEAIDVVADVVGLIGVRLAQ